MIYLEIVGIIVTILAGIVGILVGVLALAKYVPKILERFRPSIHKSIGISQEDLELLRCVVRELKLFEQIFESGAIPSCNSIDQAKSTIQSLVAQLSTSAQDSVGKQIGDHMHTFNFQNISPERHREIIEIVKSVIEPNKS